MATLSVSAKSATSITVLLSGLDSAYTGSRNYYWYIDGTYDGASNSSGSTTSQTHTFSGLDPDTSYDIQCSVQWWTANGYGDEQYSHFTVTGKTEASGTRPGDWEWWSTVAKGAEIKLSAAEWNAFTACINDFRVYAGLSEYSFTAAVSGATEISAAIVNQARTAIDAIDGHGTLPSAAVSGRTAISAAFFNDLMDALNAVP